MLTNYFDRFSRVRQDIHVVTHDLSLSNSPLGLLVKNLTTSTSYLKCFLTMRSTFYHLYWYYWYFISSLRYTVTFNILF